MLYAVVMAGGIGERFWPLSTPRRPKQLIPFFDDEPLLSRAPWTLPGSHCILTSGSMNGVGQNDWSL